MSPVADDHALDDPGHLVELDPGAMAQAVAGSGAQIRRALRDTDRDVVAAVGRAERPRALVVAGMGGSGISGDVLGAVVGGGLPTITVRGYDLPGWVGRHDTVVAVSCSGSTAETLAAATAAAHRGSHLVGIGAAGSPLHEVVARAAGQFLAVDAQGLLPRAALWTMATPLLLVGAALGAAAVTDGDLLAAADLVDEVSARFGPVVPLGDNAAKAVGAALAESVPAVWGSTALAGVVAYRAACQLNENAKLPCTYGTLPEADHNQVVAFDGPYAGHGPETVFRDPVEDGAPPPRLRLLLLRDSVEDERESRRADATLDVAMRRHVQVDTVEAAGRHPVARLATLVATVDWVSVYAAIALHVDPTPIAAIDELKALMA